MLCSLQMISVVPQWVQCVVADIGQLQSIYQSPDTAESARARGEQLHVSIDRAQILTETEDFTVCTLCQSPKPLLLRSLVPSLASQTSNINASIASQPVLLQVYIVVY